MKSASALYRMLGDEARLRILRLLGEERLNVTELTRVLGIAQSGVSRHLGLLKDSGLVEEQKEGGYTYYRTARPEDGRASEPIWDVLAEQFARGATDPLVRADEARLKEVLRLRKESFATTATASGNSCLDEAGPRGPAPSGMLLPPVIVADLGCGDGYLTVEAARWAREVIAIDRSPDVLERGRALAARRGVKNITWRRGELERLPLQDGSIEIALLSQALHHASHPASALSEAWRVWCPADGCSSSTFGGTTRRGCAIVWAIGGLGLTTTSWRA